MFPGYSIRKAMEGSTRVARHAGMILARVAAVERLGGRMAP
jgi:hypothetical protein